MELRDLRAFATVLEVGGISRAAQRLHVVQSAVSQAVRRLERELGVALLIRRPGSAAVRATEAGLLLARQAEVALHAVARAEEEIGRLRGVAGGRVRLGVLSTAAPLFLAPLLGALHRGYPRLQIAVHEAMAPELVGDLRAGRIDLAVVFLPMEGTERLLAAPIGEIELRVVAAPGRLGLSGGRVPLRGLRHDDWISFPPHHPGRRWLEEAFVALGGPPVVAVEVETLGHLRSFVEAGIGLALLPAGALQAEEQAKRVQVVPIAPPIPRVTLGWLAQPNRPTAAVSAIRSALEGVLGGPWA